MTNTKRPKLPGPSELPNEDKGFVLALIMIIIWGGMILVFAVLNDVTNNEHPVYFWIAGFMITVGLFMWWFLVFALRFDKGHNQPKPMNGTEYRID